MTTFLRWQLFVWTTILALVVAGWFGFYQQLYAHDVTYLGFATIGLYVIGTVRLGWKIRALTTDLRAEHHLVGTFAAVGLLGTFIGFALSFNAAASGMSGGTIPTGIGAILLSAVMTKLYCSIIGMSAWLAFGWQVQIAEMGE